MGDSTVTSSAAGLPGDLVRPAHLEPGVEGQAILAPAPPNPQVDATEWTARLCRYYRRYYAAPKGSRPLACGRCAPTIMDAIATAAAVEEPDARTASGEQPARASTAATDAIEMEPLPEPPHWTLFECQVKGCGEPAGVRIDGWIACLDHADDWLDRIQAIELRPELRELLPALGDR